MKRLAVIADFAEENWASMDLVAEMLMRHAGTAGALSATRIQPPFRRRFSYWPPHSRSLFNLDRLLNRWIDYPRVLKRRIRDFDCFHICDHSYSHLVRSLPEETTGVFCHDLDAYRSVLAPDIDPRPHWYKELARLQLQGLQRARIVFYSTETVKAEIRSRGLIDERKLIKAPYGIAAEYRPGGGAETGSPAWPFQDWPFLLHVGSCAPRKRIDVLLNVFASVRRIYPGLRLIQIGGAWNAVQHAQIDRLGIAGFVTQAGKVERSTIAEAYRRALLVLLPSESEGFGLPLVESISCGATIVASDITVFREVGQDYAIYCRAGDVAHWSETIIDLLRRVQLHGSKATAANSEERMSYLRKYTWESHAATILGAYAQL